MSELRFPEPMSCDHVRSALDLLLADDLDVERRGRIEGHLVQCEECSLALAEKINQAYEKGVLPEPLLPPLPEPLRVRNPAGRGAVQATDWSLVRWLRDAAVASMGGRTNAMSMKKPASVFRGKDVPLSAGSPSNRQLAAWNRSLSQSMAAWRSLKPARTRGAVLGSAELEAQHLDDAWNPIGTVTVVDFSKDVEEGPLVSSQGEFKFVITTADSRLAAMRLICRIALIGAEAIRFEAGPEIIPGQQRLRFNFHGSVFPDRNEADIPVPLSCLSLFAVPQP